MRAESKANNKKRGSKKTSIANKLESFVTNAAEATGIGRGEFKKKRAVAGNEVAEVTIEEKHRLIAEAAYFRAERRDFAPGHELGDWLEAEAEIESKLLTPIIPEDS